MKVRWEDEKETIHSTSLSPAFHSNLNQDNNCTFYRNFTSYNKKPPPLCKVWTVEICHATMQIPNNPAGFYYTVLFL